MLLLLLLLLLQQCDSVTEVNGGALKAETESVFFALYDTLLMPAACRSLIPSSLFKKTLLPARLCLCLCASSQAKASPSGGSGGGGGGGDRQRGTYLLHLASSSPVAPGPVDYKRTHERLCIGGFYPPPPAPVKQLLPPLLAPPYARPLRRHLSSDAPLVGNREFSGGWRNSFSLNFIYIVYSL